MTSARDQSPGEEQARAGEDVTLLNAEPGAGPLLGRDGKVDPQAVVRAAQAERENEAGEAIEPGGDDALLTRVAFTLKTDVRKRLDKYLCDRITFMSRSQLQRLIEGGGVLVNERLPKASTVLRAGDVVEVVVPPPPSKDIQPEDIPLDVLFEDEHLVVLNKSPDIIVHPARSHLRGTMLSALAYHFKHRSRVGGGLSAVGRDLARPGVVHRLDRHTSGCIVFAKTEEAHWKLGHQFEHRRVEKRYLAVVHGGLEPPSDLIELPIGPHPSREKGYREKYVVRHDQLGKPSLTLYRVLEWYGPGTAESGNADGREEPKGWGTRPAAAPARRAAFTLVELELRTGRTHQIRVHLSHLGYPIVGDDMYGGRAFAGPDGRVIIQRQALHAALLAFQHPVTGEALRFTAPLRGDMAQLVGALRRTGVERPALGGTLVDVDLLIV
ncbi:MAG: RluA family pseudouridine synthase [Phycisphaerae bacterium]|nr:RluA family pseudouridine synthase [Phycisphaerae bacterium]